MVMATDACDPDVSVTLVELLLPGSCEDSYKLTRIWKATDACGKMTSHFQVITVVDTLAPTLAGVPSDEKVECDSVPTAAPVTAMDNCDPAPALTFAEVRIDGDCPGDYTLLRTWTATDRCGNVAKEIHTLTVKDTTPPDVTLSNDTAYCLWPPNHRYVCFDVDDFDPEILESCSEPVTWRFAGCTSDQPDDAPGDGHTMDDCVVTSDGRSFCARSERVGGRREGRHYAVSIVAEDACGNASGETVIGIVHVPHDRSPRDSCLDASKVGCKPREPLPCL